MAVFVLNIALEKNMQYHQKLERETIQAKNYQNTIQSKEYQNATDSLRQRLSLAMKENENLKQQLEIMKQQYEINHFSIARIGYSMALEVNAKNYSKLLMALKQCLSLPPDSCAGVTGVQDGKSGWGWTLRHGPALLPSSVMEVSFARTTRKQIDSQGTEPTDSSHLEWIEPVASRPDIVWDGPIQDCFMGNRPMGILVSFSTLTAAQEWCVRAAGCAGVTRVPVARPPEIDTSTLLFVWEARQGPDLGISESGEVTYRWSLADPCRVCGQHAHGSLARAACNWDAGHGRRDIDALSLPGCTPTVLATPAAPAAEGDGRSAVRVSAVCVISLPRRGDRWVRMWRGLQARGVPAALVRRFEGVDRRAFASPDAMLQMLGYAAVNWTKFEETYAEISPGTARMERFKGKVGAWLAHLEVLRNLTAGGALADDPAGWAVLLEDDVVLLDGWAALVRKLAATARASPGVDLVYLTGRDQPFVWDGSRPGYVGVDAYAVRHSAIPGLLRRADLAGRHTRVLALDAHLSQLAGPGGGGGKGVLHVRKLWGGQSVANLFGKTASDIEV
jgi:hypothetical protein